MKTTGFAAALSALAVLAATSVQADDTKKCQAKAFFSREHAHHSGIVFVHGKKTHDLVYGTFQGGVNYTNTQTPLLRNGTIGYDKNSKAYGWGTVSEYGFLGSAKDFLFGLQMAMGSIAGLMQPQVEDQIRAALAMQDNGTVMAGLGFPSVSSHGEALNTGIRAAVNSSQARIETAQKALKERKKKQKKDKRALLEERDDEDCDDDDENDNDDDNNDNDTKTSVKAKTNSKSKSSSSSNNDTKKSSEKSSDNNDNSGGSAFSHLPSTAVVYRPPWGTARPVYFYGQCDHCHDATGYTSGGHGKFQSCTLIYRGIEYKGKVSSDKSKHMCDVDFDC